MSDIFNIATPVVTEQLVDCPIAQVWQALTDADKMRTWYFPQLIDFEPVAGAKFKFADDGAAYHKIWRVLEVVEQKKLMHSWAYQGYPGNSTVCFELFSSGKKTTVRVTHTGIASFPPDPHFARARFEAGWQTILGTNLPRFLHRACVAD